MADLRWMPLDLNEWDRHTGELLIEQEGALLRLVRGAWRHPTAPCTIPDDDAQLAVMSKLGKQWAKIGAAVRAHFTACEEHPGRLRCSWLYTIYLEQQRIYAANVARGRAGGRPRKLDKTPSKLQGELGLNPKVTSKSSEGKGEGDVSPPSVGETDPPAPEALRAGPVGAQLPAQSQRPNPATLDAFAETARELRRSTARDRLAGVFRGDLTTVGKVVAGLQLGPTLDGEPIEVPA